MSDNKSERWSINNFDKGYINSNNRFMVYLPDHHRTQKTGYVARAIVAYELYHNVKVPKDCIIHHIDGNSLNDSKENLEMIIQGHHRRNHVNVERDVNLVRTAARIPRKDREFLEKLVSSGTHNSLSEILRQAVDEFISKYTNRPSIFSLDQQMQRLRARVDSHDKIFRDINSKLTNLEEKI
ncbi:MAG: HNH endonuclease [Candidatus Bathyarchaeota archaeon]